MDERRRTPWFNKDGYRACTAYYSDGSRRTIHEHREVMEKHLGRPILPGHVVHHKDEVRDHNSIDNLEEKSNPDHARDHRPRPETIPAICPECQKPFEALARKVRRNNEKQGKPGPFCSKSCSGKRNAKLRYAAMGESLVDPQR